MCLHPPAGVHYYRVCSGTDSWPRDVLSLVGAAHCVQVSGSHQIQLCRKGMPPTSLILPEHHHVVLPQSLHSRVSVTATGLTRASVLAIAATYHPRHLRKWVRGLPHALPVAVVRKLTRHPATAGPCPDPPLSDRAYVYIESNQIPHGIQQDIDLEAHDVIVLDSLGRHGLTPHLPDRRCLWAIHYGGNGRSLEAGLRGDVIPSWCAALHSAFSAILTAASQGPRAVFKDMHVALGRPAPWPYPRP